jgi:hypothetical protein
MIYPYLVVLWPALTKLPREYCQSWNAWKEQATNKPVNIAMLQRLQTDIFIPQPFLAAFPAGVGMHLLYFRLVEHHMHSIRYVQVLIGSFILLAMDRLISHGDTLRDTWLIFAKLYFFLGLGLLTSLISYRLFFHSPRSFPGPF